MKLSKEFKKELLKKASQRDHYFLDDEDKFCKTYDLQHYHNPVCIYGKIVIKCPKCNFWRDEFDDALIAIGICDNCVGQDYCKICDEQFFKPNDWEEFPYCNNKNCEEYPFIK